MTINVRDELEGLWAELLSLRSELEGRKAAADRADDMTVPEGGRSVLGPWYTVDKNGRQPCSDQEHPPANALRNELIYDASGRMIKSITWELDAPAETESPASAGKGWDESVFGYKADAEPVAGGEDGGAEGDDADGDDDADSDNDDEDDDDGFDDLPDDDEDEEDFDDPEVVARYV